MKLKHVPNALCIARLALIPVLWMLAIYAPQAKVVFVVLLLVAFLTDFADGILCRKYDLATKFGAKLDRLSDDLLTLNTVAWLYVLRPELFGEHWPVMGALLLAMIVSVALQFRRFRRKIAFHLYAGKAANWAIALFAAHTLLYGPTAWCVYTMAILTGYALLEEIVLVTTRSELNENVTSMFDRR